MDTIKVDYELSVETRKQIAVATGKTLPETNYIYFDLALMTEDQRALVLKNAVIDYKGNASLTLKEQHLHNNNSLVTETAYLDAIPTIESLVAWLERSDERAQAAQQQLADAKRKHLDDRVASIRESVEKKDVRLGDGFYWLRDHEGEPGYAEAARVAEEYNHLVARWKEDARLAKLEQERAEAAAKAEKNAAMREWIEAHGSAHLKRAFAAGYNCTRRYTYERAQLEFPDAVLDTENTAGWKDRACPSTSALDLADAWKAAGYPDAKVMWLTAEPTCVINSDDVEETDTDDVEEEDSFAACEAVVIVNYRNSKWDLVQIV